MIWPCSVKIRVSTSGEQVSREGRTKTSWKWITSFRTARKNGSKRLIGKNRPRMHQTEGRALLLGIIELTFFLLIPIFLSLWKLFDSIEYNSISYLRQQSIYEGDMPQPCRELSLSLSLSLSLFSTGTGENFFFSWETALSLARDIFQREKHFFPRTC